MHLELTDDAKEFLIKEGCKSLDYGARPLRRAIESRVEDPLSEELLRGEFQGKDEIVVDVVWDSNHETIMSLKFEGRMALRPKNRSVSRRLDQLSQVDEGGSAESMRTLWQHQHPKPLGNERLFHANREPVMLKRNSAAGRR